MADVKSINIESDSIIVNLEISESEYSVLKMAREKLVVLPADTHVLDEVLTTGKLGNGNRIMLPNKIMKRHDVKKLHKKVPSRIFDIDGNKYLLIKLDEYLPGVPKFDGE